MDKVQQAVALLREAEGRPFSRRSPMAALTQVLRDTKTPSAVSVLARDALRDKRTIPDAISALETQENQDEG